MGACLSGDGARTVCSGSFDFPNVPAEVATNVFLDIEAMPTFMPHIVELELLRGKFSRVGSCWIEQRIYRGKEVRVRKTITKLTVDPYLSISQAGEAVDPPCGVPKSIATFTIAIEAYDGGQSCRVEWSNAFLPVGLWSRLVIAIALPRLLRNFVSSVDEEMQCYYQESLRKTNETTQATTNNATN